MLLPPKLVRTANMRARNIEGMGGYDVKVGRPKIAKYMERVRQRLNPHYDDVHSVVHKIQKKTVMVNAKM